MYGIYIIPLDHVFYNLIQEISGFIKSWIKIIFAAIIYEQITLFIIKMVFTKTVYSVSIHYSIRIQPYMNFHTTTVCFFNYELKRIIVGIWPLTLSSGKIF
ncbi:hypothetical protein SDC9_105090 [bioreactor metagenome]|uniref:Uncharacterized protein n=1 Tax=bioreactor metagenome TaxID=1076179 RepID=A0A645AYP8_9ZZZZ